MQVTDGRYRRRDGVTESVKIDESGWVVDVSSLNKWYPSGEFSCLGPTEYDLIARLPDYPIRLTFKALGNKRTITWHIDDKRCLSDNHVRIAVNHAAETLNCKVSELEVMG